MSPAASFAQTGFARFVNSPAGRIVRIVVGLALIAWGFSLRAGAGGIVLMIVGLVPLIAGAFDLCIGSVVMGGSIRGADVRRLGSQT